ncbi:MAG: 2-C-methyl-D-erythritol 4-phosphate cytidylyltransferase [Bacilli bacterium]|nr:2-C-methyl-D-erythritol 4-phosphate cytidylyltransferase [Bacilli bacterium]MBN2696647.1 2-C-methyl-D-erythritol 4-phosphate cytidylyltransferase [Bacilli bacterium]
MYSALIMAAGSGVRTGLDHNKNLHLLKAKPMILYSVEAFSELSECNQIIVVVPDDEVLVFQDILPKDVLIVRGGESRQDSVLNGLKHVKNEYVLIHDGARPNIKNEAIIRLIKSMLERGASTLAIKAKDTLKTCINGVIETDIDRRSAYLIQTPQAFRTEEIRQAHLLAQKNGHSYSDDSSVYQHELGRKVFIVEGYDDNIKVTTMADFRILEALI